jgi:hypothetical protein
LGEAALAAEGGSFGDEDLGLGQGQVVWHESLGHVRNSRQGFVKSLVGYWACRLGKAHNHHIPIRQCSRIIDLLEEVLSGSFEEWIGAEGIVPGHLGTTTDIVGLAFSSLF